MSENIAQFDHVSFGYKEEKKILDDISFFIEKGEILGLVGESGSGKSTIARCLLGLNKIKTGEIKRPDKIAMIFQDASSALNRAKTVEWILTEPLKIKGGFSKLDCQNRVEEVLKLVGLDVSYKKRYPNELSGGQRQRVCIGLALMQEPKLLIADEPVSALDVTIQAQILDLLRSINQKENLSILFISHDLRVVYSLCNHIIIVNNGKIVEEGEPKNVYRNPQHEYTKELLVNSLIINE